MPVEFLRKTKGSRPGFAFCGTPVNLNIRQNMLQVGALDNQWDNRERRRDLAVLQKGHYFNRLLEPVKKVARMLKSRLANILTYCKSRLTNGPLEGLNNKIQGLVKKAYGYRNKQRFITDIYFHCGGLDLYPTQ